MYIKIHADVVDPIGQTRTATVDENDKIVEVLTPIEIMDDSGSVVATVYSDEEADALLSHLNR